MEGAHGLEIVESPVLESGHVAELVPEGAGVSCARKPAGVTSAVSVNEDRADRRDRVS